MATRKTPSGRKTPAPPPGPPAAATPPGPPAPPTPPAGALPLPESDPQHKPFTPKVLDRTVIALPLLEAMIAEEKALAQTPGLDHKIYHVIIDLNLEFPGGRPAARQRVLDLFRSIQQTPVGQFAAGSGVEDNRWSEQYLFGQLEGPVIRELVRLDRGGKHPSRRRKSEDSYPAIHRIWPDFPVGPLLTKSVSTIKADAALNSFSTTGDKIVWAVMDSGIDALHPHFVQYDNLNLSEESLQHRDLTGAAISGNGGTVEDDDPSALIDRFGHGTHVAGIIAGAIAEGQGEIVAQTRYRDESGEIKEKPVRPTHITGIAPRCKLLSLKVLGDDGQGRASSLIAAIDQIQRINGNGRHIRVHGVNMSVGYDFEPEWFACGQSPLCVEVNRLVKTGVVVVVAAGNTGYGFAQSQARGVVAAGLGLTINDPGNADLALTVGSTHREMPHIYGVSYFSSKGPTGDGRAKPDLVAPGEKIISCASTWLTAPEAEQTKALQKLMAAWDDPSAAAATAAAPAAAAASASAAAAAAVAVPAAAAPAAADNKVVAQYKEDSGTSMAAPHVSGAIAAFLSVRREFIGQPEQVKEVFLSTATDLKRDRYFQGHGLVDLMRAIQSV